MLTSEFLSSAFTHWLMRTLLLSRRKLAMSSIQSKLDSSQLSSSMGHPPSVWRRSTRGASPRVSISPKNGRKKNFYWLTEKNFYNIKYNYNLSLYIQDNKATIILLKRSNIKQQISNSFITRDILKLLFFPFLISVETKTSMPQTNNILLYDFN